MNLKGRRALVTGATGGIGRAVAETLAGNGCDVLLNGLGEKSAIEEQRRGLEARFKIRALHHGADLSKPAEIEALVKTGIDAFGGIDILVNNAVVRNFAPVEKFAPATWDHALAVNLSAAFHTIRLVLPGMRDRGWGRIVNMSSVYGFFATTERVDYVTTKTALLGLTRAVALETAGANITCNAVCPGTVHTPPIEARIAGMQQQGLSRDSALKEFLSTKQPSGRFVAAENMAALVAFLCGETARDITGAALPVDGGWIAS
jgi:3-hydroxybutyrate dehydrogenase